MDSDGVAQQSSTKPNEADRMLNDFRTDNRSNEAKEGSHVSTLAVVDVEIGEDYPQTTSVSFANILTAKRSCKRVNFKTLVNSERLQSCDFVIPKSAIDNIKNMYDNALVRPKSVVATNQDKILMPKDQREASPSRVKSGADSTSTSNSFDVLNTLAEEDNVEVLAKGNRSQEPKMSELSSSNIGKDDNEALDGNHISTIGDFEDDSDEDEVLYLMMTCLGISP
ncbi:hypothetical protein Tco_0404759 [Tanacetum coccineum]